MPKRKRPEEDPKEQFKRFLASADEHGVDAAEAKKKFKKLADHEKKTDK